MGKAVGKKEGEMARAGKGEYHLCRQGKVVSKTGSPRSRPVIQPEKMGIPPLTAAVWAEKKRGHPKTGRTIKGASRETKDLGPCGGGVEWG